VVYAFPTPHRLTRLGAFPGLSGRKPEWLRSVAAAALAGRLDAARLRAQPRDQALAQLKQLPGIGDFSAELVLLRGAGDPDCIPRHEPRFARAVALAYNLPQPPSGDQLQRISENWRPYRTWVTLLLRTFLEGQTGEITGKPHAALPLPSGHGPDVGRGLPLPQEEDRAEAGQPDQEREQEADR
jgi:DNA-3-methyladenine glycosylase II